MVKVVWKLCSFAALLLQSIYAYPYPYCIVKDATVPVEVLPAPTSSRNGVAFSQISGLPAGMNAESLFPIAALEALSTMPGYNLPIERSFRSYPYQYMVHDENGMETPASWASVPIPFNVVQQPIYSYPESDQSQQAVTNTQMNNQDQDSKKSAVKCDNTEDVQQPLESSQQFQYTPQSQQAMVDQGPMSVDLQNIQSFKNSADSKQVVEQKLEKKSEDVEQKSEKKSEEKCGDDDDTQVTEQNPVIESIEKQEEIIADQLESVPENKQSENAEEKQKSGEKSAEKQTKCEDDDISLSPVSQQQPEPEIPSPEFKRDTNSAINKHHLHLEHHHPLHPEHHYNEFVAGVHHHPKRAAIEYSHFHY